MTCECAVKNTLNILRGTKGREIYITIEGLDWDLLNPPSGYTYAAVLRVNGPSVDFTLPCDIVNENSVKFTLNAYEAGDYFYDLGIYGLRLDVQKWDIPPGTDPAEQIAIEVDTCIYIYEAITCPPPC